MVETAAEYTEIIDGEEFVEVTGGGDFPPTFKFAKEGKSALVGTWTGTIVKDIKGEDKTIHSFVITSVEGDVEWSGEAGEEHSVWGAAILDSRLSKLDAPLRVKVIKTGKTLSSASGRRPAEYQVLVARSALG